MIKIYEECLRLLKSGEPAVLATVFDARGSAPRTAGAKMIVRADGSSMGTVGGGRLEHDTIQMACSLFATKRSAVHAFDLTGNDVSGMDMICGGRGEVWLHFLDTQNLNNQVVCQMIVDVLKQQAKGWIITEIGEGAVHTGRQYGMIAADQSVIGNLHVGPETVDGWMNGRAGLIVYTETIGTARFLIESIRPVRRVFVFGAGHVSMQVVPLCQNVGFCPIVLDDRAEYASKERFPLSGGVVVLKSFENLPDLMLTDDSFIVILTRGHTHDKTVLAQALRTPSGYIGMIGSRRKRDKIYQALLEEGFTQRDIDRVHSPIGINIEAETPAELAVSIVGELIKVRAEQEKCR